MVNEGIMLKPKKYVAKNDYDDIDNKYELIAFIVKKHWWKAVLILLSIGIMVTGFSFKCGENEVKKDPIYQRVDSKTK